MDSHKQFATLNLASLVLKLGEVNRATQHPDGRAETDTTHTIMLALLALQHAPARMDRERLLVFALVHDLPEAYAGDTNTAKGLTPEQRAAKKVAEAAAVERIRAELPWVAEAIDDYERMDTQEAGFIHILDKVCPKLCHALNRGSSLDALGMTLADVRAAHAKQGAELDTQHPDQPEAMALFWAMAETSEQAIDHEQRRQVDEGVGR